MESNNTAEQETPRSNQELDRSPKPSKITTGDYVALMETSGMEYESWIYFIRLKGNEDNLKFLQRQLEKVDWYIMEDLSTFDLDLDHTVSATTAKEITKLELNSYSFHRKFDGVLKKIDFEFKKKDSNETKICKVFDTLGYGQIEEFIEDEDLDSEDLTDNDESDCSTDNSSSESSEEEEVKKKQRSRNIKNRKTRDPEHEEKPDKRESTSGIPPALLESNIPRFSKAKRKGKKN